MNVIFKEERLSLLFSQSNTLLMHCNRSKSAIYIEPFCIDTLSIKLHARDYSKTVFKYAYGTKIYKNAWPRQ